MTTLELVEGLRDRDNTHACGCLKQLLAVSERTGEVYAYFDRFAQMLESTNSYVRTRGILLIAANARWDADDQVDEILEEYLRHVNDGKPITARQCIQALPSLVRAKPDLKVCVVNALHNAHPDRYNESMRPLVTRDIQNALAEIGEI